MTAETTPLLHELQHRPGTPVLVLWAPDEAAAVLEAWRQAGVTVHSRMRGGSPFVLAFLRSRRDVEQRAERLVSLLGGDDPVLWVAYPTKRSTRYRSDLSRDDSWQPLGDRGFEPVRQVAVDADWSALRFRRTGQIPTMTRSSPLSAEGRRRPAGPPAAEDPAVASWLAGQPEPRRSTLVAVHDLIRRTAPELEPAMAAGTGGGSVGYGPFSYRYDSGRGGDTSRLVLRSGARYVSLYVLAGDEQGYLAEQYAPELGKVSVGRSCVRFNRIDGVDLDALARLVRAAADQHAVEAAAERGS